MPQSNDPTPDVRDAQQWQEEDAARPNYNCLYGMQCPQCGSYQPFIIEVRTQVEMWDHGSDTYGAGGDEHWDDASYCRCVTCDHEGTVKNFRQETTNG